MHIQLNHFLNCCSCPIKTSSFWILTLNEMSWLDIYQIPPVMLNINNISLSLGAMAHESIEYVVIAFQNTSKGIS